MTERPVFTLETPNPFSEGTNRVYVIPSDPLTLVDSAVATKRGYAALTEGLEQLGYSISDIGRVVLTHKHIDHIGNAWRIQRESGAEILIHESDILSVSNVDPTNQQFRSLVAQRLQEWKVPEEALSPSARLLAPTWEIEPADPTELVDGQCIDLGCGELEVIHTPGHTMGSICLKYGRRLLTGDHVLPDVSPNIGGGDMSRRGMLKLYLRSLQQAADLAPAIDQVLPAHGQPFDYLERRCLEIVDHHRQRLEQVVRCLRREGPQPVYAVAKFLFGEIRDIHLVLGCAETYVHLELLMDDGRVACTNGEYSLS